MALPSHTGIPITDSEEESEEEEGEAETGEGATGGAAEEVTKAVETMAFSNPNHGKAAKAKAETRSAIVSLASTISARAAMEGHTYIRAAAAICCDGGAYVHTYCCRNMLRSCQHTYTLVRSLFRLLTFKFHLHCFFTLDITG
jgi:hypothetical protein